MFKWASHDDSLGCLSTNSLRRDDMFLISISLVIQKCPLFKGPGSQYQSFSKIEFQFVILIPIVNYAAYHHPPRSRIFVVFVVINCFDLTEAFVNLRVNFLTNYTWKMSCPMYKFFATIGNIIPFSISFLNGRG